MNNFVAYFYDITIDKLTFNNKYYSFTYLGYLYRLYLIDNIDFNKVIYHGKKIIKEDWYGWRDERSITGYGG